MKTTTIIGLAACLLFASCSENYSNGERVGVITKFTKSGLIWDSWEGHLNATQTGMNSAEPFDFSLDNDVPEDPLMVARLDSAATIGWKVKLRYHQVYGWNWFENRGRTNYFVTGVDVLERNMRTLFGDDPIQPTGTGSRDTIFVVIVPRSALKDTTP